MAKTRRKIERDRSARLVGDASFRFDARNAALLVSGIIAVVLGFYMLSVGSRAWAPILLVLGFIVLIPWGIASGAFRAGPRDGGA